MGMQGFLSLDLDLDLTGKQAVYIGRAERKNHARRRGFL